MEEHYKRIYSRGLKFLQEGGVASFQRDLTIWLMLAGNYAKNKDGDLVFVLGDEAPCSLNALQVSAYLKAYADFKFEVSSSSVGLGATWTSNGD